MALRSLSREELPLGHAGGSHRQWLPVCPPCPPPGPPAPSRDLLPARPTVLNPGGDLCLCAPPYVFGGVEKGGSWGTLCQLRLPQPLGPGVGRMTKVRAGHNGAEWCFQLGSVPLAGPLPGGGVPGKHGGGRGWDTTAGRVGQEDLDLGLPAHTCPQNTCRPRSPWRSPGHPGDQNRPQMGAQPGRAMLGTDLSDDRSSQV